MNWEWRRIWMRHPHWKSREITVWRSNASRNHSLKIMTGDGWSFHWCRVLKKRKIDFVMRERNVLEFPSWSFYWFFVFPSSLIIFSSLRTLDLHYRDLLSVSWYSITITEQRHQKLILSFLPPTLSWISHWIICSEFCDFLNSIHPFLEHFMKDGFICPNECNLELLRMFGILSDFEWMFSMIFVLFLIGSPFVRIKFRLRISSSSVLSQSYRNSVFLKNDIWINSVDLDIQWILQGVFTIC